MNVIEILNTIRDNASATYQERIPEATRNNLETIRYAMIDDDNVMVANEFMSTLLNKLVRSVVHTKRFSNPLKSLKKGKKPLGDTIEVECVNACSLECYVLEDEFTLSISPTLSVTALDVEVLQCKVLKCTCESTLEYNLTLTLNGDTGLH